jgi:osmotically-inducible protein OsmY
MKKILAIPLLLLPLTGCVPAALVVGATAGGAVIYDKRSFKTMREDQNAAKLANYWIHHDKVLKDRSHISVNVFNNIALMTGQAQTAKLRDRAYAIMQKIKNVKRIYNAVTIAGATSTLQRGSDDWITGKIRTVLLTKPGLESNDIKVVTEDGVVYLMGKISREQAELATNTARHVSGVTKVIKVFEYT